MSPTDLRVCRHNGHGAVDVPQFVMVLCNCCWRISTTTAAKFTTMFDTEAVCCCTSREYDTLILLARLMLLAVIVVSVKKLILVRRIKPQCLGCSTYLYSPSTVTGKRGSSKLRCWLFCLDTTPNLDWFLAWTQMWHIVPKLKSQMSCSCV